MKLHLNEMCHEVTIFLPNEIKVFVLYIDVDRYLLKMGISFSTLPYYNPCNESSWCGCGVGFF
jgi:hypothetical protein